MNQTKTNRYPAHSVAAQTYEAIYGVLMTANTTQSNAINVMQARQMSHGINVMKQLPLFNEWISGCDRMPKPGQLVLKYFYGDDNETLIGPIISTPIHADGSHIYNGKSIYKDTIWWMPIPENPFIEATK